MVMMENANAVGFVIKLCSKTDIAPVDLENGPCDNYGTVNCKAAQHC